MYNKEKDIDGLNIEVVSIKENGGEFKSNENGGTIKYRKYVMMVKIEGQLVKTVVDKAFMEVLDELLTDKAF